MKPKKSRSREANKLRSHLMILMIVHVVFILFEVAVYRSFKMVIGEIFMLWLCYYSYMMLNPWGIYVYIVLMFLTSFGGIFKLLKKGGRHRFFFEN